MPGFKPWTPARLRPRAWYDAHLGGYAGGIRDLSGNGRADVLSGAGSNAPLWLPYVAPVLVCPGLGSGNGANLPAQQLGTLTEFDVRAAVRKSDWADGSTNILAGGTSSAATTSPFRFFTTGTSLRLEISDGTNWSARSSTAAYTFTGSDIAGLRATWRASDGRVQFFAKPVTAMSAAAELRSNNGWTQLGTDGTAIQVGVSIANINTVLGAGRYGAAGTSSLDGYLYGVTVATTIGGAPVLDFDPTLCGQTGYTNGLSNAWTVQRATTGRKAVVQSPAAASARGVFLLGTDDLLTVPNGAIPDVTPYSFCVVARRWATAVSNGRLLSNRVNSATVGHSIFNSGSGGNLASNVQDGVGNAGTTAEATANGQRVVVTSRRDSTLVTQQINGNAPVSQVHALGASHAGAGYLVGANPGPGNFIDMEFEALLTFDRALAAAEIAMLTAFYRGGV